MFFVSMYSLYYVEKIKIYFFISVVMLYLID